MSFFFFSIPPSSSGGLYCCWDWWGLKTWGSLLPTFLSSVSPRITGSPGGAWLNSCRFLFILHSIHKERNSSSSTTWTNRRSKYTTQSKRTNRTIDNNITIDHLVLRSLYSFSVCMCVCVDVNLHRVLDVIVCVPFLKKLFPFTIDTHVSSSVIRHGHLSFWLISHCLSLKIKSAKTTRHSLNTHEIMLNQEWLSILKKCVWPRENTENPKSFVWTLVVVYFLQHQKKNIFKNKTGEMRWKIKGKLAGNFQFQLFELLPPPTIITPPHQKVSRMLYTYETVRDRRPALPSRHRVCVCVWVCVVCCCYVLSVSHKKTKTTTTTAVSSLHFPRQRLHNTWWVLYFISFQMKCN